MSNLPTPAEIRARYGPKRQQTVVALKQPLATQFAAAKVPEREARRVMRQVQNELSNIELDRLIHQSMDGSLCSVEKLERGLSQAAPQCETQLKTELQAPLEILKAKILQRMEPRSVFVQLDVDGDARINKDELESFVREQRIPTELVSKAELSGIFDTYAENSQFMTQKQFQKMLDHVQTRAVDRQIALRTNKLNVDEQPHVMTQKPQQHSTSQLNEAMKFQLREHISSQFKTTTSAFRSAAGPDARVTQLSLLKFLDRVLPNAAVADKRQFVKQIIGDRQNVEMADFMQMVQPKAETKFHETVWKDYQDQLAVSAQLQLPPTKYTENDSIWTKPVHPEQPKQILEKEQPKEEEQPPNGVVTFIPKQNESELEASTAAAHDAFVKNQYKNHYSQFCPGDAQIDYRVRATSASAVRKPRGGQGETGERYKDTGIDDMDLYQLRQKMLDAVEGRRTTLAQNILVACDKANSEEQYREMLQTLSNNKLQQKEVDFLVKESTGQGRIDPEPLLQKLRLERDADAVRGSFAQLQNDNRGIPVAENPVRPKKNVSSGVSALFQAPEQPHAPQAASLFRVEPARVRTAQFRGNQSNVPVAHDNPAKPASAAAKTRWGQQMAHEDVFKPAESFRGWNQGFMKSVIADFVK